MTEPGPLEAHRARKRFGQNFLVDGNIIGKIVQAIAPRADDCLIEIGPGLGALTAPLLTRCPGLTVIELDRDLSSLLQERFRQRPGFSLIQQDALKFDFATLHRNKPLRIVGNLPYNISTPLIFHLLAYANLIQDMHFMLQSEVVYRLAAQPGSKAYGRLSVMVQYYCQVERLFPAPPTAFQPAPRVDSAIVRLTPHRALPQVATDVELLGRIVKTAFQQRRKTLRNTLKSICPAPLTEQAMATLKLPPGSRPEQLSIEDFVSLSNHLATAP